MALTRHSEDADPTAGERGPFIEAYTEAVEI